MEEKADFGLIGLAVMGENLALNLERHGNRVAVYNRTADKLEKFASGRGKGRRFSYCRTIPELCQQLASPRRIILMVKAGRAVDDLIAQLTPFLSVGDILIDGGNSFFKDTERRVAELGGQGIHFVGCGISGGEEGALNGPSMMPGGAVAAWPLLEEPFRAIAAHADDGSGCCDWIGGGGSGHYVKMVHNGIEYSDMQLIGEAYFLLRRLGRFTPDDLAGIFRSWNRTDLESYLIEITARIFEAKDDVTGKPMVDVILDRAGQKGTGRWTAESAMELGIAAPAFAEAVFARNLSADKAARLRTAARFPDSAPVSVGNAQEFVESVRMALFASKICAYAQGFRLLLRASETYQWHLDLGKIAGLWRGGCIIRAGFLDRIMAAWANHPELDDLLLDRYFADAVAACEQRWRAVVSLAALNGIPIPAMSGALNYFDGLRSAELPANLLQAQRDFFGAHTFERVDAPEGTFFHRVWEATESSPTE